jgi:hypothetical protein
MADNFLSDNMPTKPKESRLQVFGIMEKLGAVPQQKKRLKHFFRKSSHFPHQNPKNYCKELFKLPQMKEILF